jgi:hypothetical protein
MPFSRMAIGLLIQFLQGLNAYWCNELRAIE